MTEPTAPASSTPLPLASGLIIDTKTGQAMLPNTSPDAVIDQQTRRFKRTKNEAESVGRDRNNRSIRRGIVDLPADPRACTTAGVVWLYFMLGLNDAEIAEATGLKISQVDMMKGLQLFSQLDTIIRDNLARLTHHDVQKRIDDMTGDALTALEDLLEDEDTKPATRARILMNMLDRGGFAPKQIMEHKHSLEGGLTIRHIKEIAQPKHMPVINVDKNSEFVNQE